MHLILINFVKKNIVSYFLLSDRYGEGHRHRDVTIITYCVCGGDKASVTTRDDGEKEVNIFEKLRIVIYG